MTAKLPKAIGSTLAADVLLLTSAALLLNTDRVQRGLMQQAVGVLEEHLQTEVRTGHVRIDFLRGGLTLCDVEVDDRQGRKMFRMDELALSLDVRALMRHELVVTDARIDGLKALLCQPASPTDSTFNFHFLTTRSGSLQKGKKKKLSFKEELEATVRIDSLIVQTDNGRPRKNVGRPHRGAFDAGHLDALMGMTLRLRKSDETGTLRLRLSDFHALDRGSGLQVDSMTLQADICPDSIRSDGAEAVGKVCNKGRFVSLDCDFSFTDANQMHHLKVSPRLRLWEKSNKQP